MSKNKNGGLHQYGGKPLEQQQFGIAGVEEVNTMCRMVSVRGRLLLFSNLTHFTEVLGHQPLLATANNTL